MTKKALLIGINYVGTPNELQGCINDIYNIKDILCNYYEYDEKDIKILTDRDLSPTKQNIIDSIKWLALGNIAGDSLFLHYSGHGSYVLDRSRDESDRRDEVIVPLDFNRSGFITDDWLNANLVSLIPKDVSLWLISDSCHSGTVFDLKHNYKSLCKLRKGTITKDMTYNSSLWTDVFSYSIEPIKDVQGNICLLSGAFDSQTAADTVEANQNQGAFTYCFIECLKNNLIDIDGKQKVNPNLKLKDILKEINCRLKIKGYSQNAQLSVSKQTDLNRIYCP
jgi:hypothetical protein